MRVETKTVTYYTLAELKEHHPNGYERALDMLRSTLWDDGWREDVADEITYAFGQAVANADHPGLHTVTLDGWAVQDRSAHVAFTGTLYPDDTTCLPWHEWLDHVTLKAGRYGTQVSVVDHDDAPYIPWNEKPSTDQQRQLLEVRDAIETAVDNALSGALAAGEKQAEWLESEENLLELAEANTWEFDQHGAWA